jgi:hypothetical protein
MTEDDWEEYALYWWGSETDRLSVTYAIESGMMVQFITDVLQRQNQND